MANQRIRKYVWELPVRLTHWINVLSVLTFIVTGLYIASPYFRPETTSMGWMRFLHFSVGYLFAFSMIVRMYWAFMGNKYAGWKVWFPFSGQPARDLKETAKYYAFMSDHPPYAAGHTAIAGVAYFVVFLMFGFQITSGFALYSIGNPGPIPEIMGGWLLGAIDMISLRVYHHLTMYFIISFFLVHLYISWWMDGVERNGIMGSIFGGYKFLTGKEWE
jgi:Ni/Fe-hydrogenase 1 B-type cytochrome subunit